MWEKIQSMPDIKEVHVPGQYGPMYLLPATRGKPLGRTNWLIGQYKYQTSFATALRESERLQEFLTKHRVRFGLRDTDMPPSNLERQPRYGNRIEGSQTSKDYSKKRTHSLAPPVKSDQEVPDNRISDRWENIRTYWLTQTPQSHHIVEFNNLRDIHASTLKGNGDLDHEQLPCVLLAAEFHQRYISAILKPLHRLSESELKKKLIDTYKAIYVNRGPILHPLWQVSKIILQEAKVPLA